MPAATQVFYQRRGYSPAWLTDDGLNPQAFALMAALEQVEADGLWRGDYPLDAVRAAILSVPLADADTPGGARARMEAELLFTRTFFLLAHHLHAGRLPPAKAGWELVPTQLALDDVLNFALQGAGVRAALDFVAPQGGDYRALRRALADLRKLEAAGGWPSVDAGAPLKEGEVDPRVAQARVRLRVTGELPPVVRAPDAMPEQTFDSELAAALALFQTRHGLKADGTLSDATVKAMNVPVSERISQVVLNLERLRWLPRDRGARHVVVNIPAYELEAVENGVVVLRSAVVTGEPNWETPVLADIITGVDLNPEWHVPVKIAREDLVPLLKRKPGYARGVGMRVVSRETGQEVDAAEVEWAAGSARQFYFVQEAGPQNPLGEAKLVMHNRQMVYLHGTASPAAFALPARALSHGCVRVQKVRELILWLLDDEHRGEEYVSVVQSGEGARMNVEPPVNVYLVYLTAFVGDDGALQTRPDVYRRDEKLERLLEPVGPQAALF